MFFVSHGDGHLGHVGSTAKNRASLATRPNRGDRQPYPGVCFTDYCHMMTGIKTNSALDIFHHRNHRHRYHQSLYQFRQFRQYHLWLHFWQILHLNQ